MSESDDQSPKPTSRKPPTAPASVVRPGILPLARMVAGLFDFVERESPELFERLGGKSRRASGDLGGLITGLSRAAVSSA